MISSNNLKQILTGLFNKNKEEHDKDINHLSTNMDKGWISSGTIEDIRGNDTTNDTPVGSIISVMGNNAPLHYLICDGSEYNIEEYPELAKYFEIEFSKANQFGGDGITTFAVPDLRGEFLRGTGSNGHENQGSGADVGIHQDATVHRGIVTNSNGNGYTRIATQDIRNPNENGDITSINPDYEYQPGDWENALSISWDRPGGHARNFNSRPTNTSVLYCIKYESTKLLSISMYDGTHYSTEEQIVGQWIDGKPLYQISIEHTFKAPFTANISNKFNIPNIDKILNQTGFFIRYDNNGTSDFISLNYNYSTSYKANARALYKNGTIQIDYSWAGTVENVDLVLTMQYTKTTDEPCSVDEDIAWVALDSEVDDIINRLGE